MRIKTKTVRNYGTDHRYIVKPNGFAKLWEEITGRKTVTNIDLDHLYELAVHFDAELVIKPVI